VFLLPFNLVHFSTEFGTYNNEICDDKTNSLSKHNSFICFYRMQWTRDILKGVLIRLLCSSCAET
jgi:hypothetical protein